MYCVYVCVRVCVFVCVRAYVICRMREVHDLWHVLFGCHTNVFGELALKALEFVQVRVCVRMCVCACACACVRAHGCGAYACVERGQSQQAACFPGQACRSLAQLY